MIRINTQAELDSAIKDGKDTFEITRAGTFSVSISVHFSISILGVTIEAWGSSAPCIVAWESSAPCIEAWGYVSLRLWGKMKVKMEKNCHAFIFRKGPRVTGGRKTEAFIKTAEDWCDFYGVKVKSGVAILYKAVKEGYSSSRDPSFKWTPNTEPVAENFNKEVECGAGLHFSPHPRMTREFLSNPTHYIACPVRLSDIVIHPDGDYPHKCKAPRVCAPVYEVDEDGNKI